MRAAAEARCARGGRVARALAASSLATFVALVSHVAAGGDVPPLLGVLAVLVLSWLPAVLLIGRRRSPLGLALVIGVSEFAFHLAFAFLGDGAVTATAASAASTHGMPGMSMASATSLAPTHASPMSTDGAMWLAHTGAAVLTWLLWRRGESALRAVLRAASRRVLALLPLLTATPCSRSGAPGRTAEPSSARLKSAALLAAHPRRGPPRRTAFSV